MCIRDRFSASRPKTQICTGGAVRGVPRGRHPFDACKEVLHTAGVLRGAAPNCLGRAAKRSKLPQTARGT
eukprot:13558525-Alexandrium_andersonii.AAC.1